MRLRGIHRARLNTPMTAMIDVVFLLLVFFVWTSSFQQEELLLPSSLAAAEGVGDTALELDAVRWNWRRSSCRIGWSDGRPKWMVNERPVGAFAEVQAILTEVANIGVDVPLIVEPLGDVPLAAAVRVYDCCAEHWFRASSLCN